MSPDRAALDALRIDRTPEARGRLPVALVATALAAVATVAGLLPRR